MKNFKLADFTNGQFLIFFSIGFVLYMLTLVNSVKELVFSNNLIASIFFFVTGVTAFAGGLKKIREKKLIENIPTSKIRSLAMGITELKGNVIGICKIISPISKSDCVYYMYTLEKKVATREGYRWQEVLRVKSDLPFYLKDDTSRVLVDPKNIYLDYDPRCIKCDDSDSRRYKEWYILNNEEVFLVGTAEKSNDYIQQSKDSLTEKIRELKRNQEELMKFDTNKDGIIDVNEWDTAVRLITDEFKKKEIEQIDLDPLADIVIKKGFLNDTFIISEKSEKDLTAKLFWQGTGAILTGALLYIVSVLILSPGFMFSWILGNY